MTSFFVGDGVKRFATNELMDDTSDCPNGVRMPPKLEVLVLVEKRDCPNGVRMELWYSEELMFTEDEVFDN